MYEVLVKCIGGLTTHSSHESLADAVDQADYVRGIVEVGGIPLTSMQTSAILLLCDDPEMDEPERWRDTASVSVRVVSEYDGGSYSQRYVVHPDGEWTRVIASGTAAEQLER